MNVGTGLSIVLLATVMVAGCGSAQRERSDVEPQESEEITLEVENYNFNDATIYARAAGRRQRLGTVSGNDTRTFTFRWVALEISFEIDFLSGGRSTTEILPIERGDTLELIVEQVSGSRLRLRRVP
jgi:hypothetical protein